MNTYRYSCAIEGIKAPNSLKKCTSELLNAENTYS